jgi:hypothetical protein
MGLMTALLRELRLFMRAQMVIHPMGSRSGLVGMRRAQVNLSSMNVFGCRHDCVSSTSLDAEKRGLGNRD